MVEKFPMEEEEIFFLILNLKMWSFIHNMAKQQKSCVPSLFVRP